MPSAPHNNDGKGVGNWSRAKSQFFGYCTRIFPELRRDQVCFGVDMIYDHGSRSGLSFYLLEFRISIRRFTVKDGQSPGGVSKEEQVVLGVEFDVARIRRSVVGS